MRIKLGMKKASTLDLVWAFLVAIIFMLFAMDTTVFVVMY